MIITSPDGNLGGLENHSGGGARRTIMRRDESSSVYNRETGDGGKACGGYNHWNIEKRFLVNEIDK